MFNKFLCHILDTHKIHQNLLEYQSYATRQTRNPAPWGTIDQTF